MVYELNMTLQVVCGTHIPNIKKKKELKFFKLALRYPLTFLKKFFLYD